MSTPGQVAVATEDAPAKTGTRSHESLLARLDEQRRRQVGAQLVVLEREFQGDVSSEHVLAVGDRVLEQLLDRARFAEFIPVLTYRYTKELLRDERDRLAA